MSIPTKTFSASNAAIWSLAERVFTQAISFVISIVLARLLTPYDYGVVGMTAIFITLSNVFVDAGFSNALIRKRDSNEIDYSTAFVCNVSFATIIYIVLFFGSPYIAEFYHEQNLILLIRILSITIFFYSLSNVHTAILTAKLNLKSQTIINFCSQLPSGLFAIFLAYQGFGIYALAFQQVLASLIRTILLFCYVKWIPSLSFSKESFQYFWGFGSKLMGATMIGAFFSELSSVLIGKYIGTNQLGYYTKANQLNNNVNNISVGVVQKLVLPILSKSLDDKKQLTRKFRLIMKMLVMFLAPLSAFLCFSANDIIVWMWTDKWIGSVPLFRLLVIGSVFVPISTVSLILMQAVNRTDMILKIEIPKKAFLLGILLIGFQFGVVGLCVAMIFVNIFAAVINMWVTKKILEYTYFSQFKDIFIYMIIAFSTAFGLSSVLHTNYYLLNILLLFISILTVYMFLLSLIKDDTFLYSFGILKKSICKS